MEGRQAMKTEGDRYLYRCRFNGRLIGSIGICYPIDRIVGSDYPLDREAVIGKLYERHEHIGGLDIVDMDRPVVRATVSAGMAKAFGLEAIPGLLKIRGGVVADSRGELVCGECALLACRHCGETETECNGGGYDSDVEAHDFTP